MSELAAPRRPLRLESQGEDVARLHDQLASLGLSVDAAEVALRLFGSSTRQLIIRVQKQMGLQPDGVVDEDTARALDRVHDGMVTSSREPDLAPAVETTSPADTGVARAESQAGTTVDFGDHGVQARGRRVAVSELLDTLPAAVALTPGQREAVESTGRAAAASGDDEWPVEALGLPEPQADALRSTLALARFADGDLRLVRALQGRMPARPDGSVAFLAALTRNDWITVAAQAMPEASLSEIERSAASRAAAVEVQYASPAFLTKLRDGAVDIVGYPVAKVADFLGAHPGFDVKSTSVEPFLIEHGLQDDAELKSAVLATQRVLNLGTSQAEAVDVMRAGLTSAPAVFSAGVEALNRSLGERIGESRVAAIYATATLMVSATLGMASISAPALIGPDIPALAGSKSREVAEAGDSRALLDRFPSLGTIFGDQSARLCTHCCSVLGPSAYLVDLLNSLSRAGVIGELRERRPDIALLELTCENTNAELPYVDLVLEILESAVCFPASSLALSADEQDQLDEGTLPQSVRTLLASTVSRLDGDVAVLAAAGSSGGRGVAADFSGVHPAEELAFVEGHRRWGARRARERVTFAGARTRGVEIAVPDADTDVVREGLRQGTVSTGLLTLLAPEPRLPAIGPPTVTPLTTKSGGSFEGGLEFYTVELLREVAVHLSWSGGGGGAVALERSDGGSIITDLIRDGADFVQMLADELGQGRVPQYVANLLPRRDYRVRSDTAAARRWILSARDTVTVDYDPGRLILTGLAFTGSTSRGDLTVFPENRNPLAYTVLASQPYPWSLPFDVFTEEVRACLATLGTTRRDLIRALRPGLRNASVLDASEVLDTCPAQLYQLFDTTRQTEPYVFWGLTETGNSVDEPSGDSSAPPIPCHWVGALSRLSVLLHRCEEDPQILLGALASRYVSGGVPPALEPPQEDRPSRITVAGLTGPVLGRLHRFLRLRRMTSWPLRDLDLALEAVTSGFTDPLGDSAVHALAGLRELAGRLAVPVRQAAAWVGAQQTRRFIDYEQSGTVAVPSLYEETFLDTVGPNPDADFALDPDRSELAYITAPITDTDPPPGRPRPLPVLKTLTGKIPELSRALHVKATDLTALIAAPAAAIPDSLTLASLTALARHLTFARALGLAVTQYLRLVALTGEELFPAAADTDAAERSRVLLRFTELVEDVRASGFTPEQLAEAVGMPPTDPPTQRQASLELLQALGDLQAGLRAEPPAAADEVGLRALLAAASWPADAADRVITGGSVGIGLASIPQLAVTVTGDTAPQLPAGSPFTIEPGAAVGQFVISPELDALPDDGAAAQFAELAAVPGLGPLTDAASPAARLKTAWDVLQEQVTRLGLWLQSIDLPITRAGFAFAGPIPPALDDATARLHYDASTKELVLVGYLDPPERASFAHLSDHPAFAVAVTALADQADGYRERRGGSVLLSPRAVRHLILRETSPQARFEATYHAMARPARRRHLARLAADRFAIDPHLFAGLDDAAQLADPSTDVLAPLCSTDFVAADLHLPPATLAELPAWRAAAAELRRVAGLVTTLGVRPTELAWLDAATGFTGLDQLRFTAAGESTPTKRFHAWLQAVTVYALRATIPAGAATLETIRAATHTSPLDTILSIIERTYQLPAGSATALRLDGLITQPADLRVPSLLRRAVHAAQTLRRLGTSADVALRLCQAAPSAATSATARGLFAVAYGPRTAADGLRAAMNTLRERQRNALVAYLTHRDHALDAADLHARYLLDVQMGAEMRTSRIKQAVSSTQLFIQRWLMNLEPAALPAASRQFAKAWEVTRTYRVWEANRNVFLFTQDFLEPSLRDDKSHLFMAFESTLLQTPATSERGIEALRQYVDGLDEISRMTVAAMYRETVGPRAGTVHVVGKSAHHPVTYFYRQWRPRGAAGSWDPWEPLEVVGDTEHVVVFVRDGRPHVAWLDIRTAQPTDDANDKDVRGGSLPPAGEAAGNVTPRWAVRLMWSRREQRSWLAPQRSSNVITHQKAINKDIRTSFAVRVEPTGPNGLVVRCYGGSDADGEPRPDPTPWNPTEVVTSPPLLRWQEFGPAWFPVVSVDVQVLGKTSDNRLLTLPQANINKPLNASVGIWATMPDKGINDPRFPPFTYGSSANPMWLTAPKDGVFHADIVVADWFAHPRRTLTITARAQFGGGQPSNTLTCDVDLWNHTGARFGFVCKIDEKRAPDDVRKCIDPSRRLRLFPVAAGYWGSTSGVRWQRDGTWDAAAALPWVGTAEHYCSGFQFPTGDEVRVFGKTISNPKSQQAAQERVFVSATASDASADLGWPIYLEAETSAVAGFITKGDSTDLTFLPAAEVSHSAVQRVLDADPETLRLTAVRTDSPGLGHGLTLAPGIATPYHPADPQFARALPYAGYDWEMFFHAPMMVAHALATHQRYGEALQWLQTVFDPTGTDEAGQQQWWRFPPFAAAGAGSGIALLLADYAAGRLPPEQQEAFQAQLDFARTSPFRPHGIARMRVRAYQWTVVLKYLDVVIAWGDQQFRRDTIESINEATQLYLLAAELLGRRPTQLPPRPPASGPATFASLVAAGHPDDWAPLTDTPFFKQLVAWLQYVVQRGMGPGSPEFDTTVGQLLVLMSTQSLTFCVPDNEALVRRWDRVEDRLVKIRASQNIDGVRRRLALFEPRIDPALLVQAVAAGLDVTTVLNETFAPPTPYRFSVALALAEEFTAEVKVLGASLLNALASRDAEDLARLRATQELSVLQLAGEFRQRQHDEAQANLTALQQSRASTEVRYQHYQRLLGKDTIATPAENDPVALETPKLRLGASTSDKVDPNLRGYGLTLEEADHLGWLNVGNNYSLTSGAFHTAAGILHMIPNSSVGTPVFHVGFGGLNMGSAADAVGHFFSMLAGNANFQASRSSIIAGHQRRYDDWVLASNTAGKELETIDKQILAAQIRVDLAAKEIKQHERQEENAKSVDAFMREKFTAAELYQWMADRLSQAHAGAYQLAYDLARRAQRSFAFELGVNDPGIVTSGSWESSRRGLLAGERLSLDLKRLKVAHADRDQRELEITKHVSLSMLDPIALLRLQATGSCEFTIPELVYDLDFPGHYFRRIKTAAVSLPCVVGPYTSVAGTLTLLENSLRATAAAPSGTHDAEYRRDVIPVQSVAISNGSGDTGMFELSFRDERYLPFEGAGAISRWRFELPTEFHAFDYSTIADFVVQIRYTARDGGAALRSDANTRTRTAMAAQSAEFLAAGDEGSLVRAFSLRHEFGTEWARLAGPPPTPQTISIGIDHFPFLANHWIRANPDQRKIEIWKVSLFGRGPQVGSDPPLIVQAPSGAYTGSDPHPAFPWKTVEVSEDAGLYEALLETDDETNNWTPVSIELGQLSSWTLKMPTPIPKLSDAVLAFWWRLAGPTQPPR